MPRLGCLYLGYIRGSTVSELLWLKYSRDNKIMIILMSHNVAATSWLSEIPSSYLRALNYINSIHDVLMLGDPNFQTRTHLLYLLDKLMNSIDAMINDISNGIIVTDSLSILRAVRAVNCRDLWLKLTDASTRQRELVQEVRMIRNMLTNLI